MIRAKLEYSTKNLDLNQKKYCIYCGKEIESDSEIDHNEYTNYYHCDCEDALKEIEIHKKIMQLKEEIKLKENEIKKLNDSIPKNKYAVIKTLVKI